MSTTAIENRYEDAAERKGAKDALNSILQELRQCLFQRTMCGSDLSGINTAITITRKALQELEVPVEAGGEFPEGYFAKGGAA